MPALPTHPSRPIRSTSATASSEASFVTAGERTPAPSRGPSPHHGDPRRRPRTAAGNEPTPSLWHRANAMLRRRAHTAPELPPVPPPPLGPSGRAATLPRAATTWRWGTPKLVVAPLGAPPRDQLLPLPFAARPAAGAAPPKCPRLPRPAPSSFQVARVPPPRWSADFRDVSVAASASPGSGAVVGRPADHDGELKEAPRADAATARGAHGAVEPLPPDADDEGSATLWLLPLYTDEEHLPSGDTPRRGAPGEPAPAPMAWPLPGDRAGPASGVCATPTRLQRQLEPWLRGGLPDFGPPSPVSGPGSTGVAFFAPSEAGDGPERFAADGQRLFSAFSTEEEVTSRAWNDSPAPSFCSAETRAEAPADDAPTPG